MSSPSEQNRLEELLADEAVFGLSPEDRAELDTLSYDDAQPAASDFEQTAAVYYLAAAPLDTQAMPASLRHSLGQLAAQQVTDASQPTLQLRQTQPAPTESASRTVTWIAAVAASLLMGLWLGSDRGAQPADAASDRAALLRSDGSITRVSWNATDDPSAIGASGEVVWSDAEQRGFMTFRGLAANDPTVEQYQLWIFDSQRSADHPVDGGVFDIPAGADEVVTPIDAKLAVSHAVMFAITIERPGGVVVSDRSRLPLLAKVQ